MLENEVVKMHTRKHNFYIDYCIWEFN